LLSLEGEGKALKRCGKRREQRFFSVESKKTAASFLRPEQEGGKSILSRLQRTRVRPTKKIVNERDGTPSLLKPVEEGAPTSLHAMKQPRHKPGLLCKTVFGHQGKTLAGLPHYGRKKGTRYVRYEVEKKKKSEKKRPMPFIPGKTLCRRGFRRWGSEQERRAKFLKKGNPV